MTMLLVDIFLYLFLYLYLDQVWPNDYGTQKSPLFIFHSLKKLCCKRDNSNLVQERNDSTYQQFNDIELGSMPDQLDNQIQQELQQQQGPQNDRSSALHHQEIDTQQLVKSLQMRNLTKSFSGYLAVKNLTLTLYEGQIFCLLGHNGAGKSTTINLLTGMVEKTIDMDEDLDEIRRSIGLCSQKNILYDQLTVEDHLWFYARIKLIPDHIIQNDIQNIITKCNLQNERLKYASHLSGGNKRKLCLAIALIGKSKYIFLDEPTSGVDVVTRKQIWDILREVKNEGRVIILTTHHLEEAEALADRIGIMAQGQLLCVGTVDFIIDKFGVGYYLKIQSSNETEQARAQFIQKKSVIEQTIKHFIPDCQKDPQTQEHAMKYLLPFSRSNQFSSLFLELEKHTDLLMNLQINSLEDVFVNIGLDEDRYLQVNDIQQQSNDNRMVGYSNFNSIEVPEFLRDDPQFSFQEQILVMAKRRLKLLTSNSVYLISYLFPLIIVGFGYLLAYRLMNGTEIFLSFATIALCFLSNSTGNTFIIEREKSLLYVLRVMGCKTIPYWMGTFIVDFLLSMLYYLVFLLVIFGIGLKSLQGKSDNLVAYQTFVMVFAALSTSYSYSYLFEKSYSAYMAFPFFQLFINYFLGLFFIAMSIKYKIFQIISYIFCPLAVNEYGNVSAGEELTYFKRENMNHIALFVSFCHLITAMYFEKSKITRYCEKKKQFNPIQQPGQRDQDVVQEEQQTNIQNNPISARNISKMYENSFIALNGVTFGVQRKQIFGLLGSNGAGKSTTFNILTAKDESSSGQVIVNNQVAEQTNEDAWQNVGICSQIDCLWEDLTVYDHLYMFASIKGLSGEKRERAIQYFTQTLQLDQYLNKKSLVLSGGNKRKLCVGMALIGAPNVQFFDEPSSGLDPIAKRFLWNTLKQNLQLKDASIVLTTHSMNEAESLCSKIGILVNGQFACMGSPEHLSNKYGQGYRLKLTLKDEVNKQQVDQLLFNSFQHCIKLIDQEKQVTYQIPSNSFVFSRVFQMLDNELKQYIAQYNIHYTNLEYIFQYFASFQQQYQEPPRSQNEVSVCSCEGMNAVRWCTMCCCCCVW